MKQYTKPEIFAIEIACEQAILADSYDYGNFDPDSGAGVGGTLGPGQDFD